MTDLATLTEGEFWPLIEQARDRVITNDVDALEALIVAGLPPDEMQAAAWALVQRVRGLRADLMRVQRDVVAARATEDWDAVLDAWVALRKELGTFDGSELKGTHRG